MRSAMERYRLVAAPDTFYYIADFIDTGEEQLLLRNVYNAPRTRWKNLSNRRLQNWGGLPHSRGMVAESIPQWLQLPMKRVQQLGVFGALEPNHVLVNEYTAGQGIMAHTDGPLFHPVVCTISLGSHTVLDLYRRGRDSLANCSCLAGSFLLQPRSLFVVTDSGYSDFLHGIAERHTDVMADNIFNMDAQVAGQTLERKTRVSLTIRHVTKVMRVRLKL